MSNEIQDQKLRKKICNGMEKIDEDFFMTRKGFLWFLVENSDYPITYKTSN